MSRLSQSSRIPLAALAIFAAACSGSPTTGTTPPPPPPAPVVATVAVTPATAVLTTSQTVQLTATPKDSLGATISGQTINWSSTSPSVASVSSGGLVTAIATGTASITATTGGRTGTADISVGEATTVGSAGGTVTAAGGLVVLQVPAGAVASPLAITVAHVNAPAGATGTVPGSVYEFGPTGTQFPKDLIATIAYDPAQLPAGTAATDLHIYTWNGGTSWTRMLSTVVDTFHHTVSAHIPHFSLFSPCGLFCYPSVPPSIPGLDVTAGWPYPDPGACFFCVIVNQGATSIVGTGSVSAQATLGAIGFTMNQPCAYYGCTPLPAGMLTATFQAAAPFSNPACANCGLGYTFTITVAPNTPPGRYPLVVDATGTAGGNAVIGESAALYVTVPAPGYTPSLASPSLTIAQGGSSGTTVNIARAGGFAGAIGLSVEGLPSGATATLTPSTVTGSSSSLTINVGASVPPRDYNLTLRTTAAGFADQTTPFSLTVTGSGFALAGTPPFINASAGGTAKTGIQATRFGGFAGSVSYTVSGLPMGLTAAVTASGVADSNVLTVTASASLAAGNYPLTITGTATGAAPQQLAITVTIVPPGVVAIHLDFSNCSPATMPVWGAYQDGAGAFTRVTIANGTADFNLSSTKAAVALVFPNGSHFDTRVTYLTQSELLTFNTNGGFHSGCSVATGKTINTSVAGANDVYVTMGGTYVGPEYPGFPQALVNVASGIQDAFAFTLSGSLSQLGVAKGIVRRDQNIPNGGTLAPFDFSTGEPFVAATGTGSAGGASVFAGMNYATMSSGSCVIDNLYTSQVAQSGSFPIYGVPAALQRAGDLHVFSAGDASGQFASAYFHTFNNQNLLFAGAISPTVTATAGTYRLLIAVLTVPSSYVNVALGYADAGGVGNTVTLEASTTYFGGQAVTLATPDFGNIGFLATWGPTAGGTANYSVFAASTNNFVLAPAALCTDGLVTRSASVHGVK